MKIAVINKNECCGRRENAVGIVKNVLDCFPDTRLLAFKNDYVALMEVPSGLVAIIRHNANLDWRGVAGHSVEVKEFERWDDIEDID